ncbi:MAG: hypothetical protein F4Y98_10100 [Chloroflexi bacterium]|nr:hypothetical protein [Chloroflexota bacterium]
MRDWRAPLEQDEIARPFVFFVFLFGGAALVEIFVIVHLLGIRDLLVMSLFFFAWATVGLLLFARWQTGNWNPGGMVGMPPSAFIRRGAFALVACTGFIVITTYWQGPLMLGIAWLLGFYGVEYAATRVRGWPELALFPRELKMLAVVVPVMVPGMLLLLYAPGGEIVKLALFGAYGAVIIAAFAQAQKRGWLGWLDN